MYRKVYITNGLLSLSEHISEINDIEDFHCWQEPDPQKGYNHKFTGTFNKFLADEIKSRFKATIIRCKDNISVGSIFVSPEYCLPDIAIMIYKPYRRQGYGTIALELGVKYCFDILQLEKIFAGFYEDNKSSMKMLENCGFKPHPEGNQKEKHYLTGQDIIQLDFVRYNTLNT